jgi:Glu-tRNA(Gln) amidotransferase subunit E-like FAD-binding protein
MEKIKAGIEIHQQLDTHKLFCNCPSVLRGEEPDFEVERKLHAVAGESGEVDIAARYEAERGREFIYQGYDDTTCMVELDEEPPYPTNPEALEIGLHIAMLLNCEILPIAQVMRKTVINGSNTSGFQRTVIIARNGWVESEHGRVRIENVSLEEDAAREIGEREGKIIFRLDRLGIPLVEIGTAPDISSPEQAKEVALYIGDVLRSCRVKRGIGTIRQDINISIEGHPRVEIKGFQDIRMFIPVINNEIKRQEQNIRKKKTESEVRKANADGTTDFLRPMPGAARMYPETDLPLLTISRDIVNMAKKTLPKLRSEVKKEMERKGLREEMVRVLTGQNKIEEFQSLLKILNEPHFIAKVLVTFPKEIASHEKIKNIDEILNMDVVESLVEKVKEGKIERRDVKSVMKEIAKGKSLEETLKIERADLGEVEAEAVRLIREKPGLSFGGYMGLIMSRFKGKISGKEASEVLQKLLNK